MEKCYTVRMLTDANWLPFVPVPGLTQVWNVLNSNQVLETDACVSYATIDSIETQLFQQLGIRIQFSRRFLAYISKTTLAGNTITNVLNALLEFGPVLESSWPQNDSMTWDEFYAAPTSAQLKALIAEGQQWLKILNSQKPTYDIPANELSSYLQKAPVLAFIPNPNPDHCVEVLSLTQMFNSEPASSNPLTEFIQPFTVANGNSFHQIIIEASMNTYIKKMNYNGTVGAFLPLASEDAAGIELLNNLLNADFVVSPDGTVPVDCTVVDKS